MHHCKTFVIALSSVASATLLQTASAGINLNPVSTNAAGIADAGAAEATARNMETQNLFVSDGEATKTDAFDLDDSSQDTGRMTMPSAAAGPFAAGSTATQPDMLVFTSDGGTMLVANDGEPVDHSGPVSSIEVPNDGENATHAKMNTAAFSPFNPSKDKLQQEQARIFSR